MKIKKNNSYCPTVIANPKLISKNADLIYKSVLNTRVRLKNFSKIEEEEQIILNWKVHNNEFYNFNSIFNPELGIKIIVNSKVFHAYYFYPFFPFEIKNNSRMEQVYCSGYYKGDCNEKKDLHKLVELILKVASKEKREKCGE